MNKAIFQVGFFVLFFVSGVVSLTAQISPRSNFSLQVNGQVRYAESKTPAENVLVRIESFSGGLAGQMITDRTGKFSFNGLQPQQYIVTIHAPGYIDIREDVNLVTQNTELYLCSISSGQNIVIKQSSKYYFFKSVRDRCQCSAGSENRISERQGFARSGEKGKNKRVADSF